MEIDEGMAGARKHWDVQRMNHKNERNGVSDGTERRYARTNETGIL